MCLAYSLMPGTYFDILLLGGHTCFQWLFPSALGHLVVMLEVVDRAPRKSALSTMLQRDIFGHAGKAGGSLHSQSHTTRLHNQQHCCVTAQSATLLCVFLLCAVCNCCPSKLERERKLSRSTLGRTTPRNTTMQFQR